MAERRPFPNEDTVLKAWDCLRQAIERVECARVDHVSEAVAALIAEQKRFDALLMGRALQGRSSAQ